MSDIDRDALIRMTAFEHVRMLGEVHGHLTADELKPGFVFEGERIPRTTAPGRAPRNAGYRSPGRAVWTNT